MSERISTEPSQRFLEAVRLFDAANAQDPNLEQVGGVAKPKELAFAEWVSDWVTRLRPDASEALKLAARCHHLRRWEIPRANYSADRAGYLKWREAAKRHHAEKAGEILDGVGYPPETIARVQSLVLKKNFPHDEEGRVLEDALCLVFLQRQFGALAAKTPEDKIINALQKAWKKMTPKAQETALSLPFSPTERRLIEAALGQPGETSPGPR